MPKTETIVSCDGEFVQNPSDSNVAFLAAVAQTLPNASVIKRPYDDESLIQIKYHFFHDDSDFLPQDPVPATGILRSFYSAFLAPPEQSDPKSIKAFVLSRFEDVFEEWCFRDGVTCSVFESFDSIAVQILISSEASTNAEWMKQLRLSLALLD